MPDDDLRLLGFDAERSHPMHMIVQSLVVPPVGTRPAVYSSEGSRSRGQNDLTMRLLEILRRSHEMAAGMSGEAWETVALTPDLLDRLARLRYEVFMMVNNGARGEAARHGAQQQQREREEPHPAPQGKEGRVRGNLMGKRVNQSARAVITPDPCRGRPRRRAVPPRAHAHRAEVVNATNIAALARRCASARNTRRADRAARRRVGHQLASCPDRPALALRAGDIVERHLADEDVVVFNRQPSLHMHSMQGHRVRLMPGHTFRISLPVAWPYNADFDGDEMNLHVPQSQGASAECSLLAVAQNCIAPQTNKPVMGIVQDALLGMHLLSQRDTLLTHAHACRIVGCLRHAPAPAAADGRVRAPGAGGGGAPRVRRYWAGKAMVSLLLPDDLYVEPPASSSSPPRPPSSLADPSAWDDDAVTVLDGTLLTGVLRKAHVGTGAGGIVDTICRTRGGVECMRFMGDCQRATHEFLLQRGHHVGIDDVMLSAEGHERVRERLDKGTRLCEEIQREIADGASAEQRATGERAILRLLSKSLMQTGGIVNEHMSERNSIRRMVTAGSKGSFINLSQICAALGQQSPRARASSPRRGRARCPAAHHDLSLASRRMVQNSFSLGLSPPELFMHAIGEREGLVDTSGQDVAVGVHLAPPQQGDGGQRAPAGGVVRNANGDVVCFRWGSAGFHPARVERVALRVLDEPEASVARG